MTAGELIKRLLSVHSDTRVIIAIQAGAGTEYRDIEDTVHEVGAVTGVRQSITLLSPDEAIIE